MFQHDINHPNGLYPVLITPHNITLFPCVSLYT